MHGYTVVFARPHHPRHLLHSSQVSACLLQPFPAASCRFRHLRANLLRGILHVRLVQTHVVKRRRQAPEPRLLRSSCIPSSSSCPIFSGLTAALLTVFVNPNPSSSTWRCLSLASYSQYGNLAHCHVFPLKHAMTHGGEHPMEMSISRRGDEKHWDLQWK